MRDVRPASRDHASFERARMCRPATVSTETRAEMNDDDDDALRVEAPPRAGWRRYAFPAETLALGHADTTGETEAWSVSWRCCEGALLVRAASGLGDEHPAPEEKFFTKKKTTYDAEKNRLRAPRRRRAADAPAFAEHASRKKITRDCDASWHTGCVLRRTRSNDFAAGVATSVRRDERPAGSPRGSRGVLENARTETPKTETFRATRRRARRTRRRSPAAGGGAGVRRRVPRAFAGSAAVPAEGGALDGTPGEGGADAASKAADLGTRVRTKTPSKRVASPAVVAASERARPRGGTIRRRFVLRELAHRAGLPGRVSRAAGRQGRDSGGRDGAGQDRGAAHVRPGAQVRGPGAARRRRRRRTKIERRE